MAGRIMCIKITTDNNLKNPTWFIAVKVEICPTKPHVPIPAPIGEFSSLKTIVETGPSIADARVGGINIFGFLIMFGICNMLVPSPWAIKPWVLFSLNEVTAKPIIWQQQPIVAAPAARPERLMVIQRAADEIGSVKTIPTITDTIIPMINGFCLVASIIIIPIFVMSVWIKGPTKFAIITPTKTVTIGVKTISIFVSFETNFAISTQKSVAIKTPIGPPNLFAASPTIVDENKINLSAFKA